MTMLHNIFSRKESLPPTPPPLELSPPISSSDLASFPPFPSPNPAAYTSSPLESVSTKPSNASPAGSEPTSPALTPTTSNTSIHTSTSNPHSKRPSSRSGSKGRLGVPPGTRIQVKPVGTGLKSPDMKSTNTPSSPMSPTSQNSTGSGVSSAAESRNNSTRGRSKAFEEACRIGEGAWEHRSEKEFAV